MQRKAGWVASLALLLTQYNIHIHTLPRAGEWNSTLGWIQTEFSGPEWGPRAQRRDGKDRGTLFTKFPSYLHIQLIN